MAAEEAIELLRSIDASLKQLVSIHQASAPPPVASDRDLDGKYGNPLVKVMPRDWTGASFKNRRFSECPAPLLDLLAEMNDYFARTAEEKNELYKGKPVAPYKRADAARARGWAKRVRAGLVQPPTTTSSEPASEWSSNEDDGFSGETW